MDRRDFLRSAGTAAAGLGVLPIFGSLESEAEGGAESPAAAVGRVGLQMGTSGVSLLRAASGGLMSRRTDPASGIAVSRPTFDEMSLQFTPSMSRDFNTWFAQSVSGQRTLQSGSVLVADSANRATSRLSFQNALITQVTLPAMDSRSTAPAFIGVNVQPESATIATERGSIVTFGSGMGTLVSPGFRVDLTGLDSTQVVDVSSVQVALSSATGRPPLPTATFTVKEPGAKSLYSMYGDSLVAGKVDLKRTLSIRYLVSAGAPVVFELKHPMMITFRPIFGTATDPESRVLVAFVGDGFSLTI